MQKVDVENDWGYLTYWTRPSVVGLTFNFPTGILRKTFNIVLSLTDVLVSNVRQ